jgi:hypothetical protein
MAAPGPLRGNKAGVKVLFGLLMLALTVGAAPLPGTWTTGTPLPAGRSEDSVAAAGDRVYVIGGYGPAGPNTTVLEASGHADVDSSRCDAYDAQTARWSQCADLPRGMNHVGVTMLDGRIFTFGGFVRQNRDPVTDANVYDPATDRWTPLAPLPRALGSIAVAALDGKIHLVGGRDDHSVADHLVYDPSKNAYSTAAPLPIGRDHMGLAAFGGKLYAIGGRIDDFRHNTSYCDVYDPGTDRWSVCAPMLSVRSGMAVAVYRDRIFAVGGEREGGTFTNNEAFDPASNGWSAMAPLPEGRHGTGAAVIGDRLYLPAGGPVNGGSQQSTTLHIFSLP